MALAAFACLLATLCYTTMASAAGGSTLFLSPRRSSSSFLGFDLGEEKIVGGSASTILSHPYMVSVEEWYTFVPKWFHKCGGTVLDHYNILSAAHCIQDEPKAKYRVRAGSTTRGKGGVVVNVAKVFYHPKFNPTAIDYDVGIFRMAKSLAFTFVIKPITLPKIGTKIATKTRFEIIGWGAEQSLAFEYPHRLRQTSVSVVDQATCAKEYKGIRAVSKRMICASDPGKDSCTGDSGGPMLSVKRGRSDVQYGIVSWGDVCAEAKHPGVYTNLADADIRAYIAATIKRK